MSNNISRNSDDRPILTAFDHLPRYPINIPIKRRFVSRPWLQNFSLAAPRPPGPFVKGPRARQIPPRRGRRTVKR